MVAFENSATAQEVCWVS